MSPGLTAQWIVYLRLHGHKKNSSSVSLHYVKRQAGGKSQKRLTARECKSFRPRCVHACKRTHIGSWCQVLARIDCRCCNQIYMRERTRDTYTFIALIILLGSGFDIILPPLQRGLRWRSRCACARSVFNLIPLTCQTPAMWDGYFHCAKGGNLHNALLMAGGMQFSFDRIC